MTNFDPTHHERVQLAHDQLLKLGEISLSMASIDRQIVYGWDRAEDDAQHSFHLGLSAMEMAASYHPELNVGLVAQFSYVHDLPEVYAGDTPSHGLTDQQRTEKEEREHKAKERLLEELPPHIADLLRRYEEQVEPEARFVRFIDKLLPSIMHAQIPAPNRAVLQREYGYTTANNLLVNRDERTAKLREMFPEFNFIHIVRNLLAQTSRQRMFGTSE